MKPVRLEHAPRKAARALCLLALLAGCAAAAAGQAAGGGRGAEAAPTRRLSLPGADWALDLSLPGFEVLADQFPSGGQRWLTAVPADRKKFLMLSVRVSAAERGGGREFRDSVLESVKKQSGAHISGVKTFEHGDIPMLRYRFGLPASYGMAPGLLGGGYVPPLGQRLSAFLAGGGGRAELTLVGESIGEKDEKALYAVLETARLVDTSAPSTSFDFFHKGRPFYMLGQHAKAAEFYGRALELERRERRLGPGLWRELIEEAVAVYGAVGDFRAAREVIEYGLAQEPENARLHFLMAVVHASRDDLDNTIASLRVAFRHNAGLPPHLRLPDPSKHPPFERFRKSEKFRQAVKSMKP